MSSVDGRRDPPPPPSEAAGARSKPPPLPPAANRSKSGAPPPLPEPVPRAPGSDLSIDVEIPIPVESGGDVSSIDKLLALTESDWDPDAQALTLKRIAPPPKKTQPASQPKLPAVAIPTPYELAPTLLNRSAPLAQSQSPAPPPTGSKAPPPLPPRASKGPPPLPPGVSSAPPPPLRGDSSR